MYSARHLVYHNTSYVRQMHLHISHIDDSETVYSLACGVYYLYICMHMYMRMHMRMCIHVHAHVRVPV